MEDRLGNATLRIAELEKNVETLRQKAATNAEDIKAAEENIAVVNQTTADVQKVSIEISIVTSNKIKLCSKPRFGCLGVLRSGNTNYITALIDSPRFRTTMELGISVVI